MKFDIKFTNKEITPWSGLGFLRKMTDKMGVRRHLFSLNFLPQPGSNRGYSPVDILESFMVSIWCGANRFLHTEVTRHDKALVKLFGWRNAPGNDTFKRFFKKFDMGSSSELSQSLFSWLLGNIQFDNYTLDCDSSVNTRYGEQQGAKKGYNPKKPGRNSHHPIIAFINDLKVVANFWLRSGDTHSANNFPAFLEDTLQKLDGKTIGLIRLDSGFYSKEVLSYIEKKTIDYIVAVRFYIPIQRMISLEQNWLPVDEGIEICDTQYQSPEWDAPRRLVVVRQKIDKRPKAAGRMLSLFEGMPQYYSYRYTAYVTNMKLPAAEIWRLYRQRADSENRIKELKEDFGFSSFNLKEFWATEAALTVAIFAYNLMAVFRLFVLRSDVQHTLSTLRYKIFAIGAFFQKTNGTYVLNIALAKQRRKWFKGLWNQSDQVDVPFAFSNA
jgi:hypothetical protein